MTTANDLIERTRSYLFAGQGEQVNQLTGSMLAGDTTFGVNFPLAGINQLGAVVSIDLEEILVLSTDSNLSVTSAIRGINGTTAAAHNANALVTVRPKFSPFKILTAINDELHDLSSPENGMFQVLTVDVKYNPAIQGYDLTDANTGLAVTNIIRPLEARFQVPGPSRNWPEITRYSIQRNMPTSTFPSGLVFDLYEGAYPGLPIHLRYAAPYSTLVNLTDDVTAVAGLQATAVDIPPIGAAIRLAGTREIKRNFTESGVEPRRSEEVPPGAVARSPIYLMQLRQARIKAEAMSLLNQYPYMSAVR